MDFIVNADRPETQRTDCLILGVYDNRSLTPSATSLDKACHEYLSTVLKTGDLDGNGKSGKTLLLHSVPNLMARRILLVACGEDKDLNDNEFREILRKAMNALYPAGIKHALCTLAELKVNNRNTHWKIRQMIDVCSECAYQFNDFKSKPETDQYPLTHMVLSVPTQDLEAAENAKIEGIAIADAVQTAKNLGNIPANICTPEFLAKEAQTLAKTFPSLRTTVLDEKQIASLKMGALLAVGQGSSHPPKFITIEYRGNEALKPIVLVGKGITFDTGGNSLKTPVGMIGMKFDMCGGASVLATLQAVATLKLPLHVIGVIPVAENMPGSKATRPDDIVTTLSGQTVEILNTDAEGRLILCDALSYCERFEPETVIDIATLTGACAMALGKHASGLFSNHPPLAQALLKAGSVSGDRCWELPLWEDYQECLSSCFADMANISNVPEGGAITAACFLARFTKAYHWAHLDVAGTASKTSPKGKVATGRPVSLLIEYLLNRAGE